MERDFAGESGAENIKPEDAIDQEHSRLPTPDGQMESLP